MGLARHSRFEKETFRKCPSSMLLHSVGKLVKIPQERFRQPEGFENPY